MGFIHFIGKHLTIFILPRNNNVELFHLIKYDHFANSNVNTIFQVRDFKFKLVNVYNKFETWISVVCFRIKKCGPGPLTCGITYTFLYI